MTRKIAPLLLASLIVGAIAINLWAQTTSPTAKSTGKAEIYSEWPFDANEAVKRQNDTAAALHIPKDVSVDLGKGVTMKFILIPAGTFMMGSPENEKDRQASEKQHEVTITKPFYMGVYKVKQAEYEAIMGNNPSMKETVSKTFPLNGILAGDAIEFCNKASEHTKRKIHLPTEAQWEFACRAGSAARFCFGDDETKLPEYAWFRDNLGGQLHPVGQKKPNSFGLYDVHGLMWEYCSDYFTDTYLADKIDPQGPPTGTQRTCRGGTYGSRVFFVRCSVRIGEPAPGGDIKLMSHFGFRAAMDVD